MSQFNQQLDMQLKLNQALGILQEVQKMMNANSNLSITVNKPTSSPILPPPTKTSFKRRHSEICDTTIDLDDTENSCVTLSTPNRSLPAMQPLLNRITPPNPKVARIEGSNLVQSTQLPEFKSPKSPEGSDKASFTFFKDKKPQEIWLNARSFDRTPKKAQLLLIKGNQTCVLYFQFKNSTMNLAEVFEPSSYRNLKMNGTVLSFVSPKHLPNFRFNAIVKLGPSSGNDLAMMWDKAKKIDANLSQKEKADMAKKLSPISTGQATPAKVLIRGQVVQRANTTIVRKTPPQAITIVKKEPQEIGEKSASPSTPVIAVQKLGGVTRTFTSRRAPMRANNSQLIAIKKEEMD